jgi:hypothetical protein
MLYNSCTGIYKFGNNTYPQCIKRRSNLGHILWEKKCVLWAGKYGNIANNCHDSLKSYIGGGTVKVAQDLHAFPLHTQDVSVMPVCV